MRSRNFIISCLVSCLSLTVNPLALAQVETTPLTALIPLQGQALEDVFAGKTMDGLYKIPRQRTGVNKFTESFNTDGTTEYFEGPLVDTGQWIVRGSLICFRYDGALSGGVSCFNVFQTGTCIYSYNPTNIGLNGYPINDNLWSVKTVIRGDISTCDDLIS